MDAGSGAVGGVDLVVPGAVVADGFDAHSVFPQGADEFAFDAACDGDAVEGAEMIFTPARAPLWHSVRKSGGLVDDGVIRSARVEREL